MGNTCPLRLRALLRGSANLTIWSTLSLCKTTHGIEKEIERAQSRVIPDVENSSASLLHNPAPSGAEQSACHDTVISYACGLDPLLNLTDNFTSLAERFNHLLAFLPSADCEVALLEEVIERIGSVHVLEQLALHFVLGESMDYVSEYVSNECS